eukprot:TRINITY_DN1588_c0_g2_i3.p1 TRINITY_DN1588_c0_g2~~TRINITY_DN1588_c0_g2_i3.p1  ORF type:complete len:144 (-),score=7.10 TRINITY_DN1588_c0_g2_i3:128-559(-)
MLEEEERFQVGIERIFVLLQMCSWILLGLSCAITIVLFFSLQFDGNMSVFIVLMAGMGLFLVLFCYSMFHVKNSLRNICFYIVLVIAFLFAQLAVYIALLINSSVLERLLTPSSFSLLQTYKMLAILLFAANFFATVKLEMIV